MKVSKLKKFDAAEHLQTPDARAEYLSMVLADGAPGEVRDALNVVARAQGMSQVAKAAGVTRTAVIVVGDVLAAEGFSDSYLYSSGRVRGPRH